MSLSEQVEALENQNELLRGWAGVLIATILLTQNESLIPKTLREIAETANSKLFPEHKP